MSSQSRRRHHLEQLEHEKQEPEYELLHRRNRRPRSQVMTPSPQVLRASPVVFRPQSTPLVPTSRIAPPVVVPQASLIHTTPRASYLQDVAAPDIASKVVAPNSKLLVTDLDNTLFAPATHVPDAGVQARPFLKTFISYILHPATPWLLAVWTFSGRAYGIAHLRSLHLGSLFRDDEAEEPLLGDGVAAFWGFEDSRLTGEEMAAGMHPGVKDLDLLWDMLNLHRPRNSPEWSPLNSCIVDDQVRNADAQPNSIIEAPVYTDLSPPDDFLLQLIGALDELAFETNFAQSILESGWNEGIHPDDEKKYAQRGREVCGALGIKVRSGKGKVDKAFLQNVSSKPHFGPTHDAVEPAKDSAGRVSVDSLRGCCQDPPHPFAVAGKGPGRDAVGITTSPSELYEKEAAKLSRIDEVKKPLIVFDLDGTLYTRPPCNLDPLGDPAGRPYLKTFLAWLLRPSSPWTVAIWTGSMKATAVRCLYALDLGIVGPRLIGPNNDQPELLHLKLVALWAREDVGLTPQDFNAYVSIVKDFDKLWKHLAEAGIGNWSPFDTVMVDDTAKKVRAQPDTLISAPTFDYPLGPTRKTADALLDTFLLQLVALLDELAPETNFANFIAQEGWGTGVAGRQHELVRKGLAILLKAGVAVEAEGHGPVEVPASEQSLPSTLPPSRSRPSIGVTATKASATSSQRPPIPSPSSPTSSASDEEQVRPHHPSSQSARRSTHGRLPPHSTHKPSHKHHLFGHRHAKHASRPSNLPISGSDSDDLPLPDPKHPHRRPIVSPFVLEEEERARRRGTFRMSRTSGDRGLIGVEGVAGEDSM